MSNKIRSATIIQWCIATLVFWAASVQLFQASTAVGQSALPLAGLGSIRQSQLAITGAVLCGLGSICLGVGSVLIDKRIRARKKLSTAVSRVQA